MIGKEKWESSQKVTWISSGGKFRNQINHFLIEKKWESCLQDVKSLRGANAGLDHILVGSKMKKKFARGKNWNEKKRIRYYVEALRQENLRKQ